VPTHFNGGASKHLHIPDWPNLLANTYVFVVQAPHPSVFLVSLVKPKVDMLGFFG
jgi:hypothetical protein